MTNDQTNILRETLAGLGLTIAAYSATRGDYVRSVCGSHGRLVGVSLAGCAVVAWDADKFDALCRAFDAQRARRGRAIDKKNAAARAGYFLPAN